MYDYESSNVRLFLFLLHNITFYTRICKCPLYYVFYEANKDYYYESMTRNKKSYLLLYYC